MADETKKYLDQNGLARLVANMDVAYAPKTHGHTVSEITDLTATATELNYMDGVTSNVQTQLNSKAASGHTHDDRYYTESEINTKLNGKANSSHTHAAADITSVNASAITGVIASANLPSYVDDVLEYSAKANFPATGEAGKIYVDTATNITYRWGGSAYVEISPSLALGETSSTAYRGDRGATAYTHATSDTGKALSSGLYKITTSARGHVTAGTAVTKADITGLGIPAQDTVYTHPTSSGNKHIPSGGSSGQILRWSADGTAVWGADNNTDTKVTQMAITDSDYTNWRSLIWGSSNSSTEGFTPSTVTDGVYSCKSLSVQPSSGTIRATTFKGALSGNATTATGVLDYNNTNQTIKIGYSGDGLTTSNAKYFAAYTDGPKIKDLSFANAATIIKNNASGSWGISVTGSSASCTGNAATATKATQDSAGQQINTTYIKGLSVSGRTITITKGNNTTTTITTQDTTYAAMTSDEIDAAFTEVFGS